MYVVEGTSDRSSKPQGSDRPLMVDDWAEAFVDLTREQCLRAHPSNKEPSWASDRRFVTEWEI